MAEHDETVNPGAAPDQHGDHGDPENLKPMVTRRDFLVGAGTGAAVIGLVAGGAYAANRGQVATQPAPVAQTGPGGPAVAAPPVAAPAAPITAPGQGTQPVGGAPPAASTTLPATMRRVVIDIDGQKIEEVVDVRESLWDTMTNKFGMASSNLGCDRAQCGACAILVDGKAVNGCSVLTARLGRGQKIETVNSLTKGPGVAGLHPIQRAYWQEGGFQCGICTRGFIMSTHALLKANPNPTDDQIAEALGGNICRCGEYVKIFTSVKAAAAEMRGEQVTWTAPVVMVEAPRPAASAATAPAVTGTVKQFQFVNALPTIEEFEKIQEALKERRGILEASGSERTVSVTWDSTLSETDVRRILTEIGAPVQL